MSSWVNSKRIWAVPVLAAMVFTLIGMGWLQTGRASTTTDPIPELVMDIYPGSGDSVPSLFSIAELTGKVYFNARTQVEGEELWVSDGVTTALVKDINPFGGSIPGSLTVLGNTLFFAATTPVEGRELWKSDGTGPGTELVADINNLSANSNPDGLTAFGSELFFQATDATGAELWKTDGITTNQVKNINPGGGSSPSQFEVAGSWLYFVAYDGSHGYEIWKTDGTLIGTQLVKDINPSTSSAQDPAIDPRDLTNFNSELFFLANDGSGRSLWKTDGTSAGTVIVKQFDAAANPDRLTVSGNLLFLRVSDPQTGLELWKSDGTTGGTVLVKDIYPGIASSSPNNLTDLNGILYFLARDLDNGRELWRSDGTAAGTYLVKDINPGAANDSSPGGMRRVNQLLVFQANNGVHGVELWRSNGTRAGTTLVADLNPDDPGADTVDSLPSGYTAAGNLLFFTAENDAVGRELWKLDLTNDPPQADAGGPYSGVEGSPIALLGSGTDPDGNTINYVWEVNSGLCTFNDASLAQPTLICADNGTYTVTLDVLDWWAEIDSASAQVTVSNAPPVIGQVTTGALRPGIPFLLTASFSDPGSNDTHTATIHWGDGTPDQNASIDQTAGTLSGTHSYSNGGQYTITITLTDDDLAVDMADHLLDVRYPVLMPLLRK